MKKKILLTPLGLLLAISLVAMGFAAQPVIALPKRLTFATHSVGTILHASGSGLAKVASEHSGMLVVVSPTAGPTAWVPLMNTSGNPEIGIISGADAWQAYTGKLAPAPLSPGDSRTKAPYEPNPNLRLLMMGTRLKVCILVRADSPIKVPEDLRGKRVTWGFPAFPPLQVSGMAMLRNAGLTIKDVEPVVVPEVKAGVQALVDGRLDAALCAMGMPIITEANAKVGVRILPALTDREALKRTQEVMAATTIERVAPGPAGVKVETPLLGTSLNVIASLHMPDEVAYTLVKAWWDYHKELWPIHRQLKGWVPGLFIHESVPIPYHPGAIKFYKEKGVWTAEQDKWQDILLKGELPSLK